MKRSLLLLPLLFVGGCISLFPKPPPPPRMYVLEAGEVGPLQGAPLDAVIGVAAPDGQRTFLGSDMILRTGDEIEFIGGAQWSGRAGDRLQAMLVETLSRQGRFRAALQSGGAQADYEVRWDVLSFELVNVNGAIKARFAASVRIVEASSRHVLAARPFTVDEDAARATDAGSQALARAAREGSARIGVFAAETVAQALEAKAQAEAASQSRAASINR